MSCFKEINPTKENTMYFDNAIAIHRQRIAATKAHDNYLADRLTEKLDWAVRCHVKEIGGTERKDYLNVYLSVASIALGYDQASV